MHKFFVRGQILSTYIWLGFTWRDGDVGTESNSKLWLKWCIINDPIAKWRLGSWDVEGLRLEADQPASGLNISFIAGNPRNPPPRQASRHPSNCQAVEKKEEGRERGASQLRKHSKRRLTRFLMNPTTWRGEPCECALRPRPLTSNPPPCNTSGFEVTAFQTLLGFMNSRSCLQLH